MNKDYIERAASRLVGAIDEYLDHRGRDEFNVSRNNLERMVAGALMATFPDEGAAARHSSVCPASELELTRAPDGDRCEFRGCSIYLLGSDPKTRDDFGRWYREQFDALKPTPSDAPTEWAMDSLRGIAAGSFGGTPIISLDDAARLVAKVRDDALREAAAECDNAATVFKTMMEIPYRIGQVDAAQSCEKRILALRATPPKGER